MSETIEAVHDSERYRNQPVTVITVEVHVPYWSNADEVLATMKKRLEGLGNVSSGRVKSWSVRYGEPPTGAHS